MGSDRENGEPRQIKAKAYALGSPDGDPVKPAEDAFTVNVHEGKGKILRDAFAYVSYFDVEFQNGEMTSALVDIGLTAGFYYYNDLEDAEAEVYAFVLACKRRRNIWDQLMPPNAAIDRFKVFHAPENEEGKFWYPEMEVAYDTAVFGHFELEDAPFEQGTVRLPNLYYAYAKTEVHHVANGVRPNPTDFSPWNYAPEDQNGDGNFGREDTDETESRVFPDGWSEGFNFP